MRLLHLPFFLLTVTFATALALRGETVLLYIEPDTGSLALATVAVDSSTYLAAEPVEEKEGWYRTTYTGFFGGFTRGDNVRPDGRVSTGSEIFLTPSEQGRLLAVTEAGDDIVVNLPGRWTEVTIRKTVPAYFRKQLPSQERRVPFDLAEILRDPEPLPEESRTPPPRTPLISPSETPATTERIPDTRVDTPAQETRPRLSTTEPTRDATITRPLESESVTERVAVPIPTRPFDETVDPLVEVDLPDMDAGPIAEEDIPAIADPTPGKLPEDLVVETNGAGEAGAEESEAVDGEDVVELAEVEEPLEEVVTRRSDSGRAEILDTAVEMDLEEAEVRGLDRPAIQRQPRIPPATDVGQTFQGRLVRARVVFGRAPYEFELQDSRGRRIAFIDTAQAHAADLSHLIGEVVSVYGIIRARERGRGRVIEARNIHGFH